MKPVLKPKTSSLLCCTVLHNHSNSIHRVKSQGFKKREPERCHAPSGKVSKTYDFLCVFGAAEKIQARV